MKREDVEKLHDKMTQQMRQVLDWCEVSEFADLPRQLLAVMDERDNFANLYEETLQWATRHREEYDKRMVAEGENERLRDALSVADEGLNFVHLYDPPHTGADR